MSSVFSLASDALRSPKSSGSSNMGERSSNGRQILYTLCRTGDVCEGQWL